MLPTYVDDSAKVCSSGFADDVMFSHKGGNGPESIRRLYFVKFAIVKFTIAGWWYMGTKLLSTNACLLVNLYSVECLVSRYRKLLQQ